MIHLVYPHNPERIAAPWCIGNHLWRGLNDAGHLVVQYDWTDRGAITPARGDILLGHPHPDDGHVFRDSAALPGWQRKVAIHPWGGEVNGTVDHSLVIAGENWAEDIARHDNVTRVDMAINPGHFPARKERFNPPGERRFLYMGCAVKAKNPGFLTALALRTGYFIGHIGFGVIEGTHGHEYGPIELPAVQEVVAEYDFLLMPGTFDANPTTVLECGVIGLACFVSPRSGWGVDVAGRMPLDEHKAAEMMFSLQHCDEQILADRVVSVRKTITERYTWGRFIETVRGAL